MSCYLPVALALHTLPLNEVIESDLVKTWIGIHEYCLTARTESVREVADARNIEINISACSHLVKPLPWQTKTLVHEQAEMPTATKLGAVACKKCVNEVSCKGAVDCWL